LRPMSRTWELPASFGVEYWDETPHDGWLMKITAVATRED